MNTKSLSTVLIILFAAIFSNCAGKGEEASTEDGIGKMSYAENLRIEDRDGYSLVTVRNPWDTLKTLQRYILVDKDSALPSPLPEGTLIRTPVKNALIYSAVHSGLVGDLGAGDAIGGVCNARYVTDSLLRVRIKTGEVVDCGEDMNPDVEKIIKLHPEVIMLSPFESGDRYSKISKLGIPMIQCADYMENSGLAQAEWMRFYGLLFGKGEEADARFNKIEIRYKELKGIASRASSQPKVLLDQRYGQSWSVPGGKSTMGRLISDAGGLNPFARYDKSGGVYLAPEKVLAEGGDADIWLVRYNQPGEKSLRELSADAPLNSKVKAFKEGNVYGCNTYYVPFFDEAPFHPDLLLEEMIKLFHPGLLQGDTTLRYFKKMEK
ncbi:MAG: ABC transporter substrate-binding protein [Muribaculaceae bacterium]|nr:ABC transporter substrate-binding protein [Muribaculaceae bacterium]